MLRLSAKRSRPRVEREKPYERRIGEPISGAILPFGSMIEYHLISAKDQSRLHQSAGRDQTCQGSPKFRSILHEVRRTTMFFKQKRTGLNPHTNKRLLQKPEMIFWRISGKLIYRQGFSQHHSSLLTLSGRQIRHRTCSRQVAWTIMGALTVAGNVRGHGPVLLRSQD